MLDEKEKFKKKYLERFMGLYAKPVAEGNLKEKYRALASLVKEEISKKWITSNQQYQKSDARQVYYFSIEYLLGRLLMTYLLYLGIKETVDEALADLGINLQELKDQEEDPGLGNGGLGRLAAAFLDSLASLSIPGFGYGIRYRYGLFEQKIVNGHQVEVPDNWLQEGYPWEYRRAEEAEVVRFGGHVRIEFEDEEPVFIHEGYETVRGVPYDVPIVGYRNNTVNMLRLWSAEPADIDFEFHTFSRGEYARALERKIYAQSISQVLYPDDTTYEGKKLRLKQQYFFVSAGLQSIMRRFKNEKGNIKKLHEKIAVHINDTHPALAIPELMRILVDEERMGWDEAWKITTNTVSYTNHTILPEALEKWSVDLFKDLLPRIFMIVEEINSRFCRELLKKYPRNMEKIREMAIVGDGYVRMANLAIVGSYSVNGVAKLHTEILRKRVMKSFNEHFPKKFHNITNGIVPRRWVNLANPELASLLRDTIGPGWVKDPMELVKLTQYAEDPAFQEKIEAIKLIKKKELAGYIGKKYGLVIDPTSIFDIHIKRIHAYKRQLLNAFHIMDLYNRIQEKPDLDVVPRTFIFAGKAAPAYYLAKRIIKLINTLAEVINKDKRINGKIKVVFLENYNVSLAELLFPAGDVSEQISTASKEASGTGNMKFILNGAVTLGTLDGANIEIRERVGAENFIEFGLTAEDVLNYYQFGGYRSWDVYHRDGRVKRICEQLINHYLPETGEFQVIYDHLLHHNDEFFVLKDFASYVEAQGRLEERFRDRKRWLSMCIHNIAHSGFFSSDRSIREYADNIWKTKPVPISDTLRNPI